MQIPAAQVKYRKIIGKSGTSKVFGVGTVGGLHVVAKEKEGSLEILGTGSHPAIAQYIAKQQDPKVKFDAMEKSESLSPAFFQDLLPKYIDLTHQMNEALKA